MLIRTHEAEIGGNKYTNFINIVSFRNADFGGRARELHACPISFSYSIRLDRRRRRRRREKKPTRYYIVHNIRRRGGTYSTLTHVIQLRTNNNLMRARARLTKSREIFLETVFCTGVIFLSFFIFEIFITNQRLLRSENLLTDPLFFLLLLLPRLSLFIY